MSESKTIEGLTDLVLGYGQGDGFSWVITSYAKGLIAQATAVKDARIAELEAALAAQGAGLPQAARDYIGKSHGLVKRLFNDTPNVGDSVAAGAWIQYAAQSMSSRTSWAQVAGEPVAWSVYIPSEQHGYVVDDENDAKLIDDMTNHDDAVLTPLYAGRPPAEQAEALKDAARYRWLRKQAVIARNADGELWPSGADLDEDVDAAIASAEGGV